MRTAHRTYQELVGMIGQHTRTRSHLAHVTKFDCAACGRKRALELREGNEQPYLLHCQAGCQIEDVLAACGLDMADLCWVAESSPAIIRSASQHVLAAIAPGQRITVVTHDFKGDREFALAVEIAEHVLAARHKVRDRLHTRDGARIPWEELPLTAGFIQKAARKLGHTIGEKHARRLGRLLWNKQVLDYAGKYKRTSDPSTSFLLFFINRGPSSASSLASSVSASCNSSTTGTVLSASEAMSRARAQVFAATGERAPPLQLGMDHQLAPILEGQIRGRS